MTKQVRTNRKTLFPEGPAARTAQATIDLRPGSRARDTRSLSDFNSFDIGYKPTSLEKREGIFFKCEYENPAGSVKDRGIVYQVSCLKTKGVRKAVISSSGNAAISAIHYCQQAGIDLTVFISPKINKEKLKILEKSYCQIVKTEKPISNTVKYSRKSAAANLRQSTDPNAVIGYEAIAH